MSKRSTVQPKWLDSMLVRWGIASLQRESNTLGFYKINPMLKSGIPTTSAQPDPWDHTPQDFAQLDEAIATLEKRYQYTLTRCYKPWNAPAMEELLREYGAHERTWVKWLHKAAEQIEAHMSRARAREMA